MAFADLQSLQDDLHAEFEGDVSTPAEGSSDWDLRLKYLNKSGHRWANVNDVNWRELHSTLTAAATGDKTTVASQSTYDAPDDFKKLGGYIQVTSAATGAVQQFNVIPRHEVQLYAGDTAAEYAYFDGNPSAGYKVHIHPAPAASGDTISYDYYRRYTDLEAAADVTECPDPKFLVTYSLYLLYLQQRDMTRANDALSTAEELLQGLETANSVNPTYQGQGIPDRARSLGKGFGV